MTTGPQQAGARQAIPYSHGKRAFYGLTWTLWTIALVAGAFAMFNSDMVGQGLIALVLSGVTGSYAYRIWTWQARRLIFFIVF
ncbi:hypothetical protein ACFVYA_07730 [Amycolatopsis sp. NPDC058278]|uniref:hypothetical protein n=1 Tax=Amycolatopsis sp. NPDC058278 TaxID=3346417 RepID=UPI0036DF2011